LDSVPEGKIENSSGPFVVQLSSKQTVLLGRMRVNPPGSVAQENAFNPTTELGESGRPAFQPTSFSGSEFKPADVAHFLNGPEWSRDAARCRPMNCWHGPA
jgi:hypothetical protein